MSTHVSGLGGGDGAWGRSAALMASPRKAPLLGFKKRRLLGLDRQYERKMAEACLAYLKKDSDEEWIVDYAGPNAHRVLLGREPGQELLAKARIFAHCAREGFQQGTEPDAGKLFGYYSQLVRYLDASGP